MFSAKQWLYLNNSWRVYGLRLLWEAVCLMTVMGLADMYRGKSPHHGQQIR